MLGWVAATGDFGIEAGNYILIQFFGNPSFWAIGWFLYEDYEKAGFFMPTGKKRQGYRFAGYFVWMAYSVITAFLRLHW
jgi:protoheme IX farnesyltransferase